MLSAKGPTSSGWARGLVWAAVLMGATGCTVEVPAADVGSYLFDGADTVAACNVGADCDDGDPCTTADHCTNGQCQGERVCDLRVNSRDDVDHGACTPALCSLRDAVVAAAARARDAAPAVATAATVIAFDIGGTYSLATPLPDVDFALTIDGAIGFAKAEAVVIDGADARRLLHSVGQADLTLRTLTLQHARGEDLGGAILADGGTLTLSNVIIRNCRASRGGGAVASAANTTIERCTIEQCSTEEDDGTYLGGALWLGATATIGDSVLRDNAAPGRGGAIGITKTGSVKVHGSTLSGNTAPLGGAVVNYGSAALVNCTLIGNGGEGCTSGTALANGGALKVTHTTLVGNAGGSGASTLQNSGTLLLRNSIIDGVGPACEGPVQTLAGSLASDSSCGATLVGPSDLLPVGDHGGLTPTAPPAAGSASINAAAPEFCGATTDAPVDQRGNPRPIGAGCDIGAVERAASECLPPTLLLDDGRCIDPTTAALRIGTTESTVTTSVTLLLQPPGNLVRNGDAERGDLSGWDVTVGGDGWSMTGGLIGNWSFTSSYALSWLRQVVDLRDVGFSLERLDGAQPPALLTGAIGLGHGQVGKHRSSGVEDTLTLRLVWLADDGTPLGTPWSTQLALPIPLLASVVGPKGGWPPGTRRIQVEIGGIDAEYNQGYYGPIVEGVHLVVGAIEVRFANDDGEFGAWQPFAGLVDWTLSAGSGTKTVRCEFRDAATQTLIATRSDAIELL